MPTADIKALARRLYDEVFTGGNLELIDELIDDDFVEHEEFPGLPPGKEAVRYFVTATQEAFPDLTVDVEDLIAEDNKVASRVRFSGTHKGGVSVVVATVPAGAASSVACTHIRSTCRKNASSRSNR